ncbi:MAG: sigma-70 family RNA polymerase sigma factor [Verrucomicrobiales bacterium]|nr:sigma-70 family RNA polymerase sigma factor [Verrucomicrobiales bacterium]
MDIPALLSRIREDASEEAFAILMRKYTPLVYSVGQRRLRNPSWAEDCTQEVFVRLARTRPPLRTEGELVGWLHATAHRVAIDRWRTEARRQNREEKALHMPEVNDPTDRHWQEIAGILDDALGQLSAKDQQAILMRYFQGEPLRNVGVALGLSEDAAKMRLRRALEKLHTLLVRKGVTCSIALLALLLEQRSIEAAPASGTAWTAGRVLSEARRLPGTTTWLSAGLLLMKTKLLVGVMMALVALWWWTQSHESQPNPPAIAPETSAKSRAAIIASFRRSQPGANPAPDLFAGKDRLGDLRAILAGARRLQAYPPKSLATALWQCSDIADQAADVLIAELASADYETRHWAVSGLEFILQDPGLRAGHESARLALARMAVEPIQAEELRTSMLIAVLGPTPGGIDDRPMQHPALSREVLDVLTAGFERRGIDAVSHNMVLATLLNAAVLGSGQDVSTYRDRLLRLVATGDFEQRLGAAYALSELPGEKPSALKQVLVQAVASDSPRMPKSMAAQALGRLGPAAEDTLPALARLREQNLNNEVIRTMVDDAIHAIQTDPTTTAINAASADSHEASELTATQGTPGTMRSQILNHARDWIHDPNRPPGAPDSFFVHLPVPFVEPMREAFRIEAAKESDPATAALWAQMAEGVTPLLADEVEVSIDATLPDPRELLGRAMTIAGYPETGLSATVQNQIQRLASQYNAGSSAGADPTTDSLRDLASALRAVDESLYAEAMRSFLEAHPELDRIFR